MTEAIPHSRPAHGQLVDGPATFELERRWCELTGMEAAAAVGSGLAALRLALLALGTRPGDEIIVPAYSCVALLNAPLSVGAVPVLADVIPGEWTIDPDDVARRTSKKTRAIIAVNLFGMPARVAELERFWVPVIEDCSHGPILGRTAISVSSLYATKLVGAGMGGIVAGTASTAKVVRGRRDYGDQEPDGRNHNDKMGEQDAEVALTELDALPTALAARAVRADNYTSILGRAVTAPTAMEGRVWYRYTPKLARGLTAARTVEKMKRVRVYAEQPVWDLRGTRQWYEGLRVARGFPGATEAFEKLISLPLYPDITADEQQRVVEALEEAL